MDGITLPAGEPEQPIDPKPTKQSNKEDSKHHFHFPLHHKEKNPGLNDSKEKLTDSKELNHSKEEDSRRKLHISKNKEKLNNNKDKLSTPPSKENLNNSKEKKSKLLFPDDHTPSPSGATTPEHPNGHSGKAKPSLTQALVLAREKSHVLRQQTCESDSFFQKYKDNYRNKYLSRVYLEKVFEDFAHPTMSGKRVFQTLGGQIMQGIRSAGRWLHPKTQEDMDVVKKDVAARGRQMVTVTFVRHGQSLSNEAFLIHNKDPGFFDPDLSVLGHQQAKETAAEFFQMGQTADLIIASPLRRAIKTAEIVFSYLREKQHISWVLNHNCREPITGADDIGTPKSILMKEFPNWDWSMIPDSFWWWVPEGVDVNADILEHRNIFEKAPWKEPIKEAVQRVRKFERYLAELGPQNLIVVAHGDFIEALCGVGRLGNCQRAILVLDPQVPKEILPEIVI